MCIHEFKQKYTKYISSDGSMKIDAFQLKESQKCSMSNSVEEKASGSNVIEVKADEQAEFQMMKLS